MNCVVHMYVITPSPFLYNSVCGIRCSSGYVLIPLFCVMYTTPLSTFISSLSLNHHLYADDARLFFSFHPPSCDASITYLRSSTELLEVVLVLFYCLLSLQCFDTVSWAEYPACKYWAIGCWSGCLSGARCRLFAYGPADVTASQNPVISCLI